MSYEVSVCWNTFCYLNLVVVGHENMKYGDGGEKKMNFTPSPPFRKQFILQK